MSHQRGEPSRRNIDRAPARPYARDRMIVSCGEALVDLVPDPVPGGGPMNVAVAAARLGAPAAFVGSISTDDHGVRIRQHLESNGVELGACQWTSAPTARAIIEHVPELVFRFEGDDTADTLLGEVDLGVLGSGPHLLHGGTLGLFRGQTAETLARLAESHDGIVSLDPNVRPQIIGDRAAWRGFHQRWLARADVYKGSDEDLAWIWPDRSPEDSAQAVLAGGVAVVILTRGSEGLLIKTAAGDQAVPSPTVEVVDTVGAGDTIVAAVLVSLWEWGVTDRPSLAALTLDDWAVIGHRAVSAAAITCSRPGADPPTRHDLPW